MRKPPTYHVGGFLFFCYLASMPTVPPGFRPIRPPQYPTGMPAPRWPKWLRVLLIVAGLLALWWLLSYGNGVEIRG